MNDCKSIQQQRIYQGNDIKIVCQKNEQKRQEINDRIDILQSVEGGSVTPKSTTNQQVNKSINKTILNISIQKKRTVDESDEEIDEEEFQEYFENPQKRKEFDFQRLQQQVKEIQSISGFRLGDFGGISMKELRATYPTQIKVEQEVKKNPQKNYATVSLCCLSVTNPFRIIVIDLVLGNPWFDRFFLLVIVANSIVQAMDNEVELITNYNEVIDYIFLSLYGIEMILKIIAMGFFMRPFSYLRDPWNVLDFTVIALGLFSNFFSNSNISSFRVIRILRPLKTINSMPGMSGLVTTILNSLPYMFDIMILFCFMILMFGVVGMQILGGALRFRCMVSDKQGSLTLQMDQYDNEQFCQKNSDTCSTLYPNLNISCQDYGNPVSGTYNFDNLGYAIFNIFQMITLESWSTMMYTVRDATGSRMYDLYFLLIVVIGTFIVLNLMIAVQVQNLSKSFKEIDKINKQVQDQKAQNEKNEDQDENEDENEEQEENNEDKDERTSEVKKDKKKRCCNIKKNEKIEEFRGQIFEVVSAPSNWFAKMMLGFIILNTIFLCSEFYEQPDWIFQVQFYGNYGFAIIFLMDVLVKLFAYGLINFFKDYFNIFDLVIVALSCYDTFSPGEANGYSVFRAFRLVSIFRVFRSLTGLRKLLEAILNSIPSVSNLGVLILLWLFIYSLLGKQFFNYQLFYTDSGEESRYSFQKSWKAFITTFCLLVQDNWNEVMLEVYNQYGKILLPAIYFFSAVIIGCNLLLNLFIAILLSFIEKEEPINDEDLSQNNQSQEAKQSKVDKQRSEINDGDNSQEQEINRSSYDGELQRSQSNSFDSKLSNNDDEYERIKMQLHTLSNIKIAQQKRKLAKEKRMIKAQWSNEENKRVDTESSELRRTQSKQEDQQVSDFKKTKNGKPVPINMIEIQTYNDQSLSQQIRKTKIQIDIDEEGRSLFMFSHDNSFRQFLKQIVENPFFDDFIFHIIGLNSFLLILDAPILIDQFQIQAVNFLQNIISGIFIAEFLIKIIVMGFLLGKKCYIKDEWNRLDFIIVLFSIITWTISLFHNIDLSFTKGFRALRALRPLRLVSKYEGIKTVVNAILFALPSLLNVMVIILMVLLIFSILGLQLMKGGTGSCNDTDPIIQTKADCKGFYLTPVFNEFGNLTGTNKTERVWTFPFANYNNIFSSLITFFVIATREDWASKMFMAMDVVGEDKVLKTNYNSYMCLFYIAFIFVTAFFILNLFISVIVDQFNIEIKKRQGQNNFNEEQKEWVKLQRLLCLTEPKTIPVEPINCLRLQCFKVIQSSAFEYTVMLAILCNTVFLCIDNYDKSEKLTQVLKIANIFFVSFFTMECFFKCIAYGFTYYWHVNWNKFDLFIVILSLLLIDDSVLSQISVNITCLRVLRVARLLRMIKSSEGLRSLLKALYLSLENILTTASLLLLLFFTFTVAGISLFGNMTFNDNIGPNVNFQSFYVGIMTLFRASTGENWASIMTNCYEQTGIVAIIFWLIFQSSTYFIFLNVFIAVVYESFAEIQSSEDENDILSLKKKDIKAFQNTWAKYNPMGELYMRTLKLSDFLRDLPPPLGYQGIRIEQSKINKIIFCLNIRDHLGRVYYPEVMWSIFHSIAGINDEKVMCCEQVINNIKVVKMKYKGLGRGVNLDTLCGNKYYRNDLTAIKYLQAMKILEKWKNFQVMKKNQREKQGINEIADQIVLQNSSNIQYNVKTSYQEKLHTENDKTQKIEYQDYEGQKNEKLEITNMKKENTDRSQRVQRNKHQGSILSDDFDKEADKEQQFTERRN